MQMPPIVYERVRGLSSMIVVYTIRIIEMKMVMAMEIPISLPEHVVRQMAM